MWRSALSLAVAAFAARALYAAWKAKPGDRQVGNCLVACVLWFKGYDVWIGHSRSKPRVIPHVGAIVPESGAFDVFALSPRDRQWGSAAIKDSPIFSGEWSVERKGSVRENACR